MSENGGLASASFNMPFTKLRGLRSLRLNTPSLFPYLRDNYTQGREDGRPPALRTLEISDCGDVYLQWLWRLKD